MLVLAPFLHVVAVSGSDPVGAIDFLTKSACRSQVTGIILGVILAAFRRLLLASRDVVNIGLHTVSKDYKSEFM